jgi:hypothetical protein
MSGRILLSEKYGVNPSVGVCYICGEDCEVVLFGRMKGDAEAPRRVVVTKEPCPKCKEWMTKGVIMISVKDDGSTPAHKSAVGTGEPDRTGGWCVLKDEAIERMLPTEHAQACLKSRVCFIDDSAWDHLGLPRGDVTPE